MIGLFPYYVTIILTLVSMFCWGTFSDKNQERCFHLAVMWALLAIALKP